MYVGLCTMYLCRGYLDAREILNWSIHVPTYLCTYCLLTTLHCCLISHFVDLHVRSCNGDVQLAPAQRDLMICLGFNVLYAMHTSTYIRKYEIIVWELPVYRFANGRDSPGISTASTGED